MTLSPYELGPILVVLGLLALVLSAFIRDWAAPDVIAMSGFCLLVIFNLLPVPGFDKFPSITEAFTVFSNPAPITIAAMFIMSAALEKTGVIDWIGSMLNRLVSERLWLTLPALMTVVAASSAFVNNTPMVAILLPVLLAITRRKHVPASKLLIPLSYAAVLGGCCTLIGTSTNIIVNGIAIHEFQLQPLGMFEFTKLGLILAGIGIAYVTIFGPFALPDRASITAVLGPQDRQQFLCHVLIKPGSPLVGQRLTDTELAEARSGFRIIEVRRTGARVTDPINEVVVRSYDRVLLAVSSRNMTKARPGEEALNPETADRLQIENLSVIKGAIIEGVVAPHSRLIGKSLKSARFRQAYGMLVLAVHRSGKNLASNFQNAELEFGDTVLMLGPVSTFQQMRDQGDFMLLEDQTPMRPHKWQALASIGLLGTVVALSAFEVVPIMFASVAACVVAMWLKCLSPQEAYKSIDWTILFMLYGMLGLGLAMDSTGAATWIAKLTVAAAEIVVPDYYLAWLPFVALSLFYLTGSLLTEVLSNNATAIVLAPIAIKCALSLGCDPRPFVFAVAFSSSAAFSTPIGYQTHMMVYGAGGYRFSDFVRFGLPLNLLLWAAASWFIPQFWPLLQVP